MTPEQRQAVFDKVSAHLLKQNARATDQAGCLYLNSEGLKCAIGCLIPDGHAAQSERLTASNVYVKYDDLAESIGYCHAADARFLNDLQKIHDDRPPEDWPRKLREFALEWKLVLAVSK